MKSKDLHSNYIANYSPICTALSASKGGKNVRFTAPLYSMHALSHVSFSRHSTNLT